jgi:hypothetical protein
MRTQLLRQLAVHAPLALVLLAPAAACQKVGEPVPSLTQDQWRRVRENLLDAEPTVEHPSDAVFGDAVRLIGWDVDPDTVEAGGEVKITLYWEVLQPITERWQIFIHLDAGSRQNLDHEAVEGTYPSVYWEPGQIIRDEVTATLQPTLGDGEVKVLIGFFRGDERMPVTRAGEATLEDDGRLNVGSFQSQWNPPELEARRLTGTINVDGRLTEPAWRRARQTDAWLDPSSGAAVDLETRAKVLWDDEFIYIGMEAADPDIFASRTERDTELWEEEVLEIYLDGNNDGRDYIEFQINPLGTVFDAVFPRSNDRDWPASARTNLVGLETAVHIEGTIDDRGDSDTKWTAEFKLPLSSIPGFAPIPPIDDTTLRVNFYRYDRSEGRDTTYFAWSPVGGGTFHRPDRFGLVRFTGAPRTAPVAAGSGDGSGGARLALPGAELAPPRVVGEGSGR